MPRTRQSIAWVGRIALLTGSTLVCWALVEVVVLPLLIHEAPLDRQRRFTVEMQILAQDTKAGLVPHDYVLILGDSYAKGYGDWLLSADYATHPPFHSAHVVHDETGREVLSFGRGGAGSVAALVLQPRRIARALARFGLEPPKRIVVYFYAGNDLSGNLRYLTGAARKGPYDLERLRIPEHLDTQLRNDVAVRDFWPNRFWATVFTPRVAIRLMEEMKSVAPRNRSFGKQTDVDVKPPGKTTRARIGGQNRWLPDGLQGPDLNLTREEFDHGLLVLDRSLASLREFYPDQPILVVYVPSVLESYEMTSARVSTAAENDATLDQPASFLVSRGAELAQRVAEISRRGGYAFLDPTPALRAAGARETIHGPRDWDHFNEAGYRVLGREIASSGFVPRVDSETRNETAAAGERPTHTP